MDETVTLPGDHGFAAAIYPKGELPNLADVAAKYHREGKLGFGISREGAATALRLLADQLDAEAVIPQEMIEVTKTTVDDFTLRTVTFTFAVKHERKA